MQISIIAPLLSGNENCSLTSTVFVIEGQTYCIHCGKKPRHVSKTISFGEHVDIGKVCSCEGAIQEVADYIAIQIFNQSVNRDDRVVPKQYSIKKDHFINVVSKMNADSLPLNGYNIDSSHMPRCLPKIDRLDYVDFEQLYVDLGGSSTLSLYMKDDYYKDMPSRKLAELISMSIEKLKAEAKNKLLKRLESISQVDSNVISGLKKLR